MKNYSIAVLALKILSLYTFIRAMTSSNIFGFLGPVVSGQGTISVTELTVLFASIMPMVFMLLCSVLLWTQAERVALVMVQHLQNDESEEGYDFYKVQVLAVGITGIFIAIGALSQIPDLYSFFYFNPSAARLPDSISDRAKMQIAVCGIQTLIGFVLFSRPQAVVRFFNRYG